MLAAVGCMVNAPSLETTDEITRVFNPLFVTVTLSHFGSYMPTWPKPSEPGETRNAFVESLSLRIQPCGSRRTDPGLCDTTTENACVCWLLKKGTVVSHPV